MSNNIVIGEIRRRLWRLNKNWLCCIVGETGSGKSWCALRIAELIDKNFDVDLVFFSANDFIKAINEGKIKKGSCVVLDEAGISWGTRDWMKQENKDLSRLFQIMRFMNFGLIMTVPSLFLVDKHGRDLIHAIVKTVKINHTEKFVWVQYKINQYNPIYGQPYRKWIRVRKTFKKKVTKIRIHKPNMKLIRQYEKKKKAFAKQLTQDIEKRMDSENELKNKFNMDDLKKLTCHHCSYTWIYKGKRENTNCPSCKYKVKAK